MQIDWKKSIFITADVLIFAYLLVALTAFNTPDERNKGVCSQVKINISDGVVEGFLDVNGVKEILKHHHAYPLAKPLSNINTRNIEETLEGSPFVDGAECYKTQNGHVVINIKQRMPLMRIMADNGEDYYIDNKGGIMSASKYTTNLIIATGNISRKYASKTLTMLGNKIMTDKFWQNQVVQVNVLNDGTVELVPRVGNHIIYLGTPERIDTKLGRVEKFYRYGLSKAGWNKYSVINVEFDNQIICKKSSNLN